MAKRSESRSLVLFLQVSSGKEILVDASKVAFLLREDYSTGTKEAKAWTLIGFDVGRQHIPEGLLVLGDLYDVARKLGFKVEKGE